MSVDVLKIVERTIISKDREFYEELIAFRGDIITEAEHRAWLDWADDLVMERYSMSSMEAEGIVRSVEEYYKAKEIIL